MCVKFYLENDFDVLQRFTQVVFCGTKMVLEMKMVMFGYSEVAPSHNLTL